VVGDDNRFWLQETTETFPNVGGDTSKFEIKVPPCILALEIIGGGGSSLRIGFDKNPHTQKSILNIKPQNATCDKLPVVAVRTSRSEEIQATLIRPLVIRAHSMCAIIQSFWGAKIVRGDPSSLPPMRTTEG
jgi:hypothetical protein